MVHDYASDRVGTHMTADMIKGLQFSQQERVVSPIFYPVRTRVECDRRMEYFIVPERGYPVNRVLRPPTHHLDFEHAQFDERYFPQHFDISLFHPNTREQDETEAMGAEDSRLYPDGMPAADTPRGVPTVDPLCWTRVGEGKWVSQPVSSPP